VDGGTNVTTPSATSQPVDQIGLFTWDRSARLSDWSESASRVIGVPHGAARSTSEWLATVHPDDRERALAEVEAIPLEATSYQLRYRVVRADGTVAQVMEIGVAVDDDAPPPYRYVGIIVDWTTAYAAIASVEAAHDHLRAVLDNQNDPLIELVAVRDDHGAVVNFTVVAANTAAEEYTGGESPLVGRLLTDLMWAASPGEALALLSAVLDDGEPLVRDGSDVKVSQHDEERTLDVRAFRVRGGVAVSWRDVTERQREQEAVRASERMFRSILEGAAIGMAVVRVQDGRFLLANPALCRLLGREPEWFTEHVMDDIILAEDVPIAHQQRRGLVVGETDSIVGEIRLVRAGGTAVWARRAGALVRDSAGRPELVVVQIEDVTEQRLSRERLEYIAYHDPLTGLPNRVWIHEAIERSLGEQRGAQHDPIAVLHADIDRFAIVNDSLGHSAGDTLITVVGHRIASRLRASDAVARVGGDEFVVVLREGVDRRLAERMAEEISRAVSSEALLAGHRITPALSLGIALSEPGSTADQLLRDADAALMRAKRDGRRRWEIADQRLHQRAVESLTLEDELRQAITHRQFVVHYQPIVRLDSGDVVGHEALVRWQHPERGLLLPGAFMEVAEASGLVAEIDGAVLEQVCLALGDHRLRGTVSVNVSAVDLRRPTWLDDMLLVLGDYGVDPRRLVLEITETTALAIPTEMRWSLDRLRDLGIGLHVDDFGTGFSSISLLQDLPVTGLKLDRRFVHALTTSSDSPENALAAGLAGLASGLGLVGIAEGVETREQWDALRGQGWGEGQGFLFGRPAPLS